MKAISISAAILCVFIFGCAADTKEGVEDLIKQSSDLIKELSNNAAFLDADQGKENAFAIGMHFGLEMSKCPQHDYKCQYAVAKERYEASKKFRDHYVEINKTFVKPSQELLDASAWKDACLKIVDAKYSDKELPYKQGDLVRAVSVLLITSGGPTISEISTSGKRTIGVFVRQPENAKSLYETQHVFKRAVQIVPENECVGKRIPGNEQIGKEMLAKYMADKELDEKFALEQRDKAIADANSRQEENILVNKLQAQASAIVEEARQARIKEIEESKLSYPEKQDAIYNLNKTFNDNYYRSVLYPLYKKAGLDKYVRE